MVFSTVLEDILTDIDEDITDTEVVNKVKKYINRGYRELAKKEGLVKSKTLTFESGKAKKPVDCFNIIGVYYNDEPVDYYIKGAYIICDLETAEIIYNYIPEPLEDLEDEFLTTEANSEYIIAFAKNLYYINEGMFEESTIFRMELDRFVIENKPQTINKIIDVYGGFYV